jgi:rhodanese-related sulfurtransferase
LIEYSVVAANRLWRQGALAIIDVREQVEYDTTRVEGMPLIPMSGLLSSIDDIPADLPLAIFCRSGKRSAQVADYLTAAGDHGEVANIEGGIIAWAAEGLPYVGEPPR